MLRSALNSFTRSQYILFADTVDVLEAAVVECDVINTKRQKHTLSVRRVLPGRLPAAKRWPIEVACPPTSSSAWPLLSTDPRSRVVPQSGCHEKTHKTAQTNRKLRR